MTETEVAMMIKWGTWEELLLGGAVLRHGTQAWHAVAAEIRSRTPYPFSFTAEVCKAKYEDLQERYCGCNAWFEELRKRRVAELKRELEKSNNSIGTLETKLESLKGEEKGKGGNYNLKYDSNQTESPISNGSSARVGLSGKEASNSKDGLSAGSFTEENRVLWSPEAQVPANVSTQETVIKQEQDVEKATPTTTSVETVGGGRIGGSLTKRRGKRKRKVCGKEMIVMMPKEGSFGESDVLSSIDARVGDERNQILRPVVDGDHRDDPIVKVKQEESSDLMEILDLFMERGNENASVFRNRLDSQKKARYKKTIRCHVDLGIIRSKIANNLITSDKELFRDLLLLVTNAMVFYPKNSSEYVSALALKELAIKTFRQDRGIPIKDTSCSGAGGSGGSDVVVVMAVEAPVANPRVKPRSIRPRNRKVSAAAVAEEVPKVESKILQCDVEIPPGFAQVEPAVKKSGVKPVKVGRGNGRKRRHENATVQPMVEETPKEESNRPSEVGRGNVGRKRRRETAIVQPLLVEEATKEESKKLSVDNELSLLDSHPPVKEEPAKKVRVRSGNVVRGVRVKRESETPVTEKKRARRR